MGSWDFALRARKKNMANFRHLAKLPLSRIAARQFSVSSRATAYLDLNPTPYARAEADADLATVVQKEKGSWKDLSKEEKLQREYLLRPE